MRHCGSSASRRASASSRRVFLIVRECMSALSIRRLQTDAGHDAKGDGTAERMESDDPRQPMERLIPGAYNVGGRRMPEPTGPARDSSLGINKAPGIMLLLSRSAERRDQYSPVGRVPPVA